jgi:anti-sigma factor RsiW
MARAYSGVLGSTALCFVILRGLFLGSLPDDILVQALVVFGAFCALGFFIGWIADQTVCDSVENRFRSEMARIHAAVASTSDSSSEQKPKKLA